MKRRMARLPPPAGTMAFAVLLTLPALASAFTIPNPLISSRQVDLGARSSTCGDSSYVQCGDSFPSDFCCPSTSTCESLAGGTTVLCCPTGSNCTQIEPIPCELSLEDKSQHPAAVVMTTALTGTLESCGSKCCPFGYSCNSDDVCQENSDQSTKPSTSAVASSSTATTASSSSGSQSTTTGTVSAAVSPTTVSGATVTSTATSGSGSSSDASSTVSSSATGSLTTAGASSTGDSSPEADTGSHDSTSHAGVVAGGVIGGIAGAICLGLLIMWLVKRELQRKKLSEKDAAGASSDDGSSNTNKSGNLSRGTSTRGPISKPIPHDVDTLRSDFSRRIAPYPVDHYNVPATYANHEGGSEDGSGVSGLGLGATPYMNHDGIGGRPSRSVTSSPGRKLSADRQFDDDTDHDGENWTTEVEEHDTMGEMRSPPAGTSRGRAASSLYGELYRDTTRGSTYPDGAPRLKMPGAHHYGGFDRYDGFNPVSEYAGNNGGRSDNSPQDPNAAYINVFADENALSPHSLGPPGANRFGGVDGMPGDRETRFSDFRRGI